MKAPVMQSLYLIGIVHGRYYQKALPDNGPLQKTGGKKTSTLSSLVRVQDAHAVEWDGRSETGAWVNNASARKSEKRIVLNDFIKAVSAQTTDGRGRIKIGGVIIYIAVSSEAIEELSSAPSADSLGRGSKRHPTWSDNQTSRGIDGMAQAVGER
jgi:hypothetical protein